MLKMSDKLYSNGPVYGNINNVYNRAPCAKQTLDTNQHQQFYSYNMPINNSYNQLEAFSMISPQNCHKNQNVSMYPDMTNWDNRICEDTLKIPDKIEMIEITSKDLSPASYCSNLDLLMPDFYKTLGKDLNYFNKFEGQFNNYNSNQKIVEYPSCAQSSHNQGAQIDKTVKYCSIQNMQKTQEFDYHSYNSGMMYSEQGYNYNNFYDPKLLEPLQNQYFDITGDTFQPIDQQTEGSNDESDIIVEESDEEITDCVEYDNTKIPTEANRCIICNVSYTPMGTQFYFLTLKSPLTMSSQKPVFTKIVSIVGRISNEITYLCSECLGLINTIDHLQLKLDNFNAELLMKFQRTCQDNNVDYNKKSVHKKRKFTYRMDRQLKCKFCKKILSLKQMCHSHLKRHKFKGFLCELCGKISSSQNRFKLHYQKHKNLHPKISSFVCTNCPKTFRTKSNLVEHENYCLGLLPFPCKFCDKKFPSPTKLKNHVKLKHDKKFIAICSICNIGFVKLSDYKSHKISHSTDKKFSCKKCDKSYKTLSNLNFHMKVHNSKLPFLCTICNKGFMRKEYLEAHVNNHNGVKNFLCNMCDKKFVSQKNLDSHLKYHDGSAKTKTCNVCGKVMITGFEEHLRIHNNLREFECDQCDSKFNTKGTLAKHKKRKHVND